MKLVLVHGRQQGKKNAGQIQREWAEGLRAGFAAAGLAAPSDDRLVVPFYGARLDELTAQRESPREIVHRGAASGGDVELDEFERELLEELRRRAAVTDEEVEAEMTPEVRVRERAPWNWEWVQAIGRALDKKTPWVSDMVMGKFTRDVKAYLGSGGTCGKVCRAVHAIIEPALAAPCVVVAHSLGTIVTYRLLTEMKGRANVPLWLTAGSPLGMQTIKNKLKRPLGKPAGVKSWLNVSDERDPVALHAELGGDTFPGVSDNISDVQNPKDDAHSIVGYLSDARVARRIAAALDRR